MDAAVAESEGEGEGECVGVCVALTLGEGVALELRAAEPVTAPTVRVGLAECVVLCVPDTEGEVDKEADRVEEEEAEAAGALGVAPSRGEAVVSVLGDAVG